MNDNILVLKPEPVWKKFHALTQLPRPSKKEDKIRKYLVNFGKKLNLETIVDEIGNVIIRKPATPGMENRKGVILQGHMDMVPQANSDKVHDFENDPIETIVDKNWVRANGTTLGSDNGMGVAVAMAILESTDIPHGPIEALFTTDEETGMTGASGLKPDVLTGDILMNLDSEDEGELYIGCAGGINVTAIFTYKEESFPNEGDYSGLKISVTGLRGGHSGVDIDLGCGNANKIMNRILRFGYYGYNTVLSSLKGGSLRNAIPRESFALVALPSGKVQSFLENLKALAETIRKEIKTVDPDLKIEAEIVPLPEGFIGGEAYSKFLRAIYACPNGVIRMSNDMPGLVETSNNLAVVEVGKGEIKVLNLLRSSVDSAKEDSSIAIESALKLAGAKVTFDGSYPGWKPNPDSPILKVAQDVYNKMFNRMPEIKAIHAGLECGILGGTYPNWDMISFGPTIRHPHSPDEKVNIESVQRFWDFLLETLKNIPEQQN